tara:strand:+ start:230 stop:715 length:486 start_codon:yes stop_codon:yes gene_type:complete
MYDPAGDGSAKVATDILSRVRVRTNMKKEIVMLDQYDVQENETPEILADRHHGSPHYHWIIMLLNEISDVNHDWVKSTRQLQKYLTTKYTDTQLTEAHHYEISQTSGDTTIKIEVENTTYPSATTVTNYEYEVALNESKRRIDLLRNDYLGMFVDEFTNMV